jgi:two-component system, chemotaxis family, chemotaxis protein CheY
MTHRILVGSNSSSLRQSIYHQFKEEGFQIFEAASGQEILAIIQSRDNLDLVLIDGQIQEMDGIEIVRQIRKISVYRFLPIIMLVNKRSKTFESKGLAAGITGYINQSVTSQQLRTVVNRLLG